MRKLLIAATVTLWPAMALALAPGVTDNNEDAGAIVALGDVAKNSGLVSDWHSHWNSWIVDFDILTDNPNLAQTAVNMICQTAIRDHTWTNVYTFRAFTASSRRPVAQCRTR